MCVRARARVCVCARAHAHLGNTTNWKHFYITQRKTGKAYEFLKFSVWKLIYLPKIRQFRISQRHPEMHTYREFFLHLLNFLFLLIFILMYMAYYFFIISLCLAGAEIIWETYVSVVNSFHSNASLMQRLELIYDRVGKLQVSVCLTKLYIYHSYYTYTREKSRF